MAVYEQVIEVNKDTYVHGLDGEQYDNFGSRTYMELARTPPAPGYPVVLSKWAYIQFPTPDPIPAGKEYLGSFLRVYCTIASMGSSSTQQTSYARLTSNWGEYTVSAVTQLSNAEYTRPQVNWSQNDWVDIPIDNFIQDLWNGETNRGIILHIGPDPNGASLLVRFNSREAASNRPHVVVRYRDHLPLKPTSLVPNGINIYRGQTVNFSWLFNSNNANDKQTKFDLEWSDDDGETWTRITQTTENTFYAMSTAAFSLGRVYWRVRTYDNFGQVSDWSDQAYVDVSGSLPPTNLVPNSVHVNIEQSIVFSWRFNSGVEGDQQTKFDLQWSHDDGQTWSTITETTSNTSYTMPPYTLPQGNIIWRVRTYDSLGQQSDWSQQAFITTIGAPNPPTITMPNIATQAKPYVSWHTNESQLSYEVQVWDGTELFWTSGEVFSALKTCQIEKNLINHTTYTIRVRIKSEYNIWSDWATKEIVTEYAEPKEPIVTLNPKNGYIEVEIKNTPANVLDYGFIIDTISEEFDYGSISDEPAEYIDYGLIDEASVEFNEIYRREVGGEWIRIAVNVPTDGSYQDYSVASGVKYEYMAVAYGIGGGIAESAISNGMITLKGTWIHVADNPQETVYVFMFSVRDDRGDNWQPDVGFMQFAGRVNPVAEYGDAESYSVRFNLRIKDNADFEQLKKLARSKKTLCYRDPRGRKVFGIIQTLPFHDRFFGYDTALEIIQTDYKEGI